MAAWYTIGRMESLPAERKVLVFSVGGVRLALRLSQVREIVAVPGEGGEIRVRGASLPALPVSVPLGLDAPLGEYALVTESSPPLALRVGLIHGIVDLARAEVFQLPARTLLPQPAPFQGAIVVNGEVALELAVGSLGWAPMEPASDRHGPPPELDSGAQRELHFCRAGRTLAVPLSLLVQVLESPRICPVPLTPPSHRGVLYHGRAIHPVFDVAALYGDTSPAAEARTVLLLDAAGTPLGVLADRVVGVGEARGGAAVVRPSWDALFAV